MGWGDDGRVEYVSDFQPLGMKGWWYRQHRTRPLRETQGRALDAFSLAATVKNQLTGNLYDPAGNLTNDGTHTYYYNAENRLIQIDGTLGTCSTATACYIYDAEGRRIQSVTGSTVLDFILNIDGGNSGTDGTNPIYLAKPPR